MSSDNVIPFRKRLPSGPALEMYRHMTRHWTDEMKQLMFPDHFRADQLRDPKKV